MQNWIFVGIALLLVLAHSAYQPEMMLTTQPQFINRLIANNSDAIIKAINSYPVPDLPPIEQKVAGVKVYVHLTKIHQKVDLHWTTNLIEVVDKHAFKIKSKNVNITLTAHIDAKVGLTRKQSGTLVIKVSQIEVNTTIMFDRPACAKSLGFDVQIKSVDINNLNADIKIEGKAFDNLIISQVEKIIKPRIPSILQNAITTQINPMIATLACNRVEEEVEINDHFYLLTLNTTTVPSFDNALQYLQAPIDITFQNMVSNQTNNQLQNDDIPGNADMFSKYDATLSLSSNFMNTVIWLVGDAKLLNLQVTNDLINNATSDPPIALNTTNLSILLPTLKTKEWENKEVILLITPSTPFEHLLIRSGRIVTVLSLSIKFVVKLSDRKVSTTECIASGDCVVATDLNMTLPLSLAMRLNEQNIVGLLHTVSLHQVSIIKSLININVPSFKSIVNSIIGSMIPTVNSQLAAGMQVDLINKKLQQFHITALKLQTFKDYMGVAFNMKI